MRRGFTCSECHNLFFQGPKCVSCGAQKLYDLTVKEQWKQIEIQAARIAELEAQNDTLRHATDKLRFALEKLNEKHQPLTLAFLTAVELLNDAALEGKKDEA